MIRIALVVLLAAVLIVTAISLQGDPGVASLTWLGWRVDTTAAAAVLIIGLMALMATVFWRALVWLAEAPRRAERARAESRRRQGAEALTRGFLASAAGNGGEARRLAQRAADLAQETPQLVRLLAAQAAEAAGDRPAAEAAYKAMLGFPEMRLAAYRGLMQTALAAGDGPRALANAQAAFELAHTAPWAWRALLQARLAEADWPAALTLVNGALERKIVSPLVAERARAAVQTASAAGLEARGAPGEALDLAQAAAKARPDFTPAAVIAARLLAADGRAQRATPILEAAWAARSHPAIWLAWRDLRGDETPKERAARLAQLAQRGSASRETTILRVEQALIGGDPAAARTAARELQDQAVSQRVAGLMARVANANGEADEARAWIVRGAGAPEEADWSDIAPTGRAFAYGEADWARVILAYAETGELTHPRHERGEAGISALPDLPAAYADSAAFVSAAEAGDPFPPIVDDGDFGDALQPAGDGAPPTRRGLLGSLRGR
ncbi:MAG TPA: heme biosynthesis HemY N-terminal domain-containing protein [Caulobacteraceae bacterium]|jgi:HemY protein|nr:heme biosynthesis HemY N-terminal domain-containing protein [Caulobacteraceae bacterium]